MPVESAVPEPLLCRMQKLLVASTAMHHDGSTTKPSVMATLPSGGDSTEAEARAVVELMYGELKRQSSQAAVEDAFERCAAGMPLAGEAVLVEDAKTSKLGCYDIGHRDGVTGTRAMLGRPTNPAHIRCSTSSRG